MNPNLHDGSILEAETNLASDTLSLYVELSYQEQKDKNLPETGKLVFHSPKLEESTELLFEQLSSSSDIDVEILQFSVKKNAFILETLFDVVVHNYKEKQSRYQQLRIKANSFEWCPDSRSSK